MALPTSYLTSTKNVPDILREMQTAQAPPKFNRNFLEGLGFKGSADRLLINVLKSVGLLSSDGTPTQRYYAFLDQTQSGRVLAEGLREAYADLFQLNRNAQNMPKAELKGKIKTLTQGKPSESVVDKMANTFLVLAKQADWSTPANGGDEGKPPAGDEAGDGGDGGEEPPPGGKPPAGALPISGLVYNIQIQLPESRDQAVYDALFKSLKTHLVQ